MPRRTKSERYDAIRRQLADLFRKTGDPGARRATAAAVLFAKLPDVSWVGFYMLRGGALVVDAYQGPVACLVLPPREGVCWAAIDRREGVIVPDVREFPGHVACDARSRSELVLPVPGPDGALIGTLDLDSTTVGRFDEEDLAGAATIVEELATSKHS